MLMLSEAILYVPKKLGLSGTVTAGTNTVASADYTLLDMLALALDKGMKLAKFLFRWVLFLVRKMMQMLGRVVKTTDEVLSKEFISGLLRDMHKRVQMEVTKVLDGLKNS